MASQETRHRRTASDAAGTSVAPAEFVITWASNREGRQPPLGPIPVMSLAKDFEVEIADRVRRVPSLVRSALLRIGRRLEAHDPLDRSDRMRVIDKLFPAPAARHQFLTRFLALMALSVALASLGILADSTAVVIGAMLVAPFMGPVLGVAAALTMAWPQRVFRQAALMAVGVVLGVSLAFLISLLVPRSSGPLPAELLARTSPNLIDLGIAVAAGAAGAYAQVRRQASDALPGVAIAVALVPPLAATGIALEMGAWKYAHGAFLLFAVNVVGTVGSAALMFIVAGFVPGWRLMTGNSSIAFGLRLMALAVVLVVLPLQFGRERMLPAADRTADVVAAVHDFVDEEPADVVDISILVEEGVTEVDVVVAGIMPGPPVTALANFVAERIDAPVNVELKVVEAITASASVLRP